MKNVLSRAYQLLAFGGAFFIDFSDTLMERMVKMSFWNSPPKDKKQKNNDYDELYDNNIYDTGEASKIKDGFSKLYNMMGVNNGYDRESYDRDSYDRDSYDREGYDDEDSQRLESVYQQMDAEQAKNFPFEETEKSYIELYTPEQKKDILVTGLAYAEQFVTKNYLSRLSSADVLKPDKEQDILQYRMYHIKRLLLEEKEDINDKLVSIYGALHSIEAAAYVIIRADGSTVNFYVGTRNRSAGENEKGLSGDLAGGVLEMGLKGNFTGSRIEMLGKNEMQALRDACVNWNSNKMVDVAAVTALPSPRDSEAEFVQGVEKLIDALSGRSYTAIFLAEPLTQGAVQERRLGLEQLYSTISPFSKTSVNYGENYSAAVSDGITKSLTESINSSVSHSNSEGVTRSTSTTKGKTVSDTSSFNASHSDARGYSESGTFSGGDEADKISRNEGSNQSSSDSVSVGKSHSESYSTSSTESYGTSSTWTEAVTQGTSTATSVGSNHSNTYTEGNSRSLTINHDNKSVSNMMEMIDAQLERIKSCESFGLWNACAYFISEDSQAVTIASSLYRSLVTGDNSRLEASHINFWRRSKCDEYVLQSLRQLRHPVIQLPAVESFQSQRVRPTAMVSGKELPMILSLPRSSISGMVVDNVASFGREVYFLSKPQKKEKPFIQLNDEKQLWLGNLVHKGIENEQLPVKLDMELLRSHCFVTGSTGSGKSNTTYQLLKELHKKGIRFLVIEPAKGEYKIDIGKIPDLNVFWTNPTEYPLIRINPFRFAEGVHVLEHLDRLIDIFNACWPLYSAMPSILKTAIQQSYIACGWDLNSSIRFDNGKAKFPTFLDLERELRNVINHSSYSAESKGEYIGALVTRIEGLTSGIMGQVFCAETDIDDSVLFDEYTVVDLSRAASTETKALIMGVLVMKLNEYRMATANGRTNQPLKHITVLEEAHNLLKRVSGSASEMQQKSVEMLSSSIAEMRTFGEGFLIIDQSPSSVDISAIKNTNTKIVMNLPLKEDFEVIGGSFALTEQQIAEISRLGNGVAIVKQSSWLLPVMVHVAYAGKEFAIAEGERISYNRRALIKAVGLVCETMLEQCDAGKMDSLTLAEYLQYGQLNRMKEKEYRLMLSGFEKQYNSTMDKTLSPAEKNWNSWNLRGSFLMQIMGCQGLFKTLPLKLDDKTENPEQVVSRWEKRILNALREYAVFSKQSTYTRVLKLLAWERSRKPEGNSYSLYLKKSNVKK